MLKEGDFMTRKVRWSLRWSQRSFFSGKRLQETIAALVSAFVLVGTMTNPSAQAQTYLVLHSFTDGTDGRNPEADLVRDTSGNLYGTARFGGAYGGGIIFKLDTNGTETILYNFTGGSDGGNPVSGLVLDAAGNLYGVASGGGNTACSGGCGTVFELDTTGQLTVLYSFTGRRDGASPAGLIRDAAGNLYGTASAGGDMSSCNRPIGCGTVFKLDLSGNQTVLHTFSAVGDGRIPVANLLRDKAGNLYGTTSGGGNTSCTGGCGTVFMLTAAGKEKVLYTFTGGADGRYPVAGLVADAEGNLYSTTEQGGDTSCSVLDSYGCGAVFKLDPADNETVLYNFTGGSDGGFIYAGLVRDPQGNLYGASYLGGAYGWGTVFRLDTALKLAVLHSFTLGAHGASPVAGLLRDAAGDLFGTACCGGISDAGVVFAIKP
jgi:uncharacterized repeat protein (TIGR03803 family)